MASIELEGVRRVFDGGHVAIRGLDLRVADGELCVLVGPSGCGKSTLLRLVAGLEPLTAGRILLGGRDVTHAAPRDRDLAMVFQSYALYPHMSVRENLAFGLRMRGVGADEIRRRTQQVAERLRIADVLERRPAQLSGGQRQRVALGRAMARKPRAFLLDEPLSNLDAGLRGETRAEIARLHHELRATMLYVTHDQEEAMTLGDRVAVLREGALEQIGPPLDVYRRPTSRFVADFMGLPRINWFEGELADGRLRLRGADAPVDPPPGAPAGRALAVGVRPQDLSPAAPGEGHVTGRVEVVEPLGSAVLVHARTPSGDAFRMLLPPDTPVRVDERLSARIDPAGLHTFDPESGVRLG